MQIKTKKVLIIFFVIFYLFSFYFNQFYYFFDRYFSVYAQEEQVKKNNLYLIFVEKKIYSQIKNDLKRYVVNYIQQKYYNTIAKVVIVNNDLKSVDVLKYIQKQYFDNTWNVLKGIVLIWNIPLPKLNYRWFVFPSVYPYVDLIDKKYIYNPKTWFFDYVWWDNKPELTHSVIRFETIANYHKFFQKLKKYYNNPNKFVSRKFYYEDFISLKSYYNKENQPYYVNSLIFAEDILNHHFTNLLLKLLEWNYLSNVIKGLKQVWKNIEDYKKEASKSLEDYLKTNPDYAKVYNEYFKKTKDFVEKWKVSGDKYLSWDTQPQFPTKIIAQAIKNFIKPVTQLFSPSYIEKIANNVNRTGRWKYSFTWEKSVDYALKEIVIKDKISALKIQSFNNLLRKAIDKKIEENRYYMLYPVFVYYQQYERPQCKSRYLKAQYENFYFWKYAGDITGAQDFTIYRWTYKNYTELSQISWESILWKDLGTIGKSFWFMQRQIEANRWYNVLITEKDAQLFENMRCAPGETLKQWAVRYWWGASPLNVDWQKSNYTKPKFYFYNYKYSWNPSWNKNIWWWIFDLGGGILTDNEVSSAYDWKAYKVYSAPIKTKEWIYNFGSNTPQVKNLTYCQVSNKKLMYYPEFFSKYGKNASEWQYFQVNVYTNGKSKNYISEKPTCVCRQTATDAAGYTYTYCALTDYKRRDYYYYKLIDTRVWHISPTASQIKKISDITAERPIDDPKYITFLGIGGDTVKFIYPDLWKVPVYKRVGDKYVLKSIPEIKQSIKEYLKSTIEEYNKMLKEQLNKSVNYYNQYKDAFDFLWEVDERATPNRTYSLLSGDYLIKVLGDKNIDILAEALYYRSLGWSIRPVFSNFLKDIDYLRKNFNVNEKISYIEDSYFSDKKVDPKKYPNIETNGYEAGFINSDWADNIWSNEVEPKIISDIKRAIDLNTMSSWSNSDLNYLYDNPALSQESKCGIPPDGAVPLFQWPSAFACWLSSLPKSFKVGITNDCSFTIWNWLSYTVSDIANNDKTVDIFPQPDTNDKNLSVKGIIDKYFRVSYNDFVKKHSPDLWEEYQLKWFYKYVIYWKLTDKLVLDKLSEQQKAIYNDLKNTIGVSIYPNNFISVEDKEKNLNLYFNSNDSSLWDVNVSIGAIWKSCINWGKIYLGNIDICKEDYQFKYNTYEDTIIPLKVDSNVAGNNLLQIKLCKNDICVLKSIPLLVAPWNLAKIEVVTLWNRIIDGWKMPIRVDGYDIYWNKIDQLVYPYRISVNFGNLIIGNTKVKTYEFSNFKDARFILDLWNEKGLVWKTLKIVLKPIFEKSNYPVWEKDLKIVNSKIILSKKELKFKLPDKFDTNLSGQIEVKLAGNISSPITIRSKNGLVKVYANINGKQVEGNYFIVDNWKLKVVLKPSYRAWEDEIIFDVPGLSKKSLKVKILPANPKRVEISLDKSIVSSWDNVGAEIRVEDIWGNMVDKSVKVKVWVDLWLNFKNSNSNTKIVTINWKQQIDLVSNDKYSKWYVWAKINDLDLKDQIPDYKSVSVEKINWPINGVKVMYLSLFGNDWWNLRWYFSNNKNVANNLLAKSSKTLAITTQLIDPEKLNRVLTIVKSDGSIVNLGSKNVKLILSGSKIYYWIESIKINLWNVLDYILTTSKWWWNEIVYIPKWTDSFIYSNEIEPQNKQIKVNWQVIIDFDKSFISPDVRIIFKDNKFHILWKNKYIWDLLVKRNDSYILDNNSDFTKRNIGLRNNRNLWLDLMIVNTSEKLSEEWEGVKWILLARDPERDVWFKEFPNISLWAAWKNVWEATLKDANEFVINFWDMFLERLNTNEQAWKTSYDWSRWDLIYFDENGGIKKVLVWDFNNDNLKDILVAYNDWRIKLLKNYWLDINPFVDLWDLMIVKNWIKNIYIGDVNGDWYEDLIVWTNKDQLLYYKNEKWQFSIDWKLICLNVPESPSLKGVKQLFVKDMDWDWKFDIVTNDINGDIKIFYWNTYISQSSYKCDANRKNRLKEKIIASYALTLKQDKVYDNSLVHWQGLSIPNPGRGIGTVVDENWKYIDSNLLVRNGNWDLEDLTYQKVLELYNKKVNRSLVYNQKYIAVPSNVGKPLYEDWTGDVWYYAVSSLLTGDDWLSVYKRFEKLNNKNQPLRKGDIVKVTVYINNLSNTTRRLTYLDNLQWPWQIDVDSSWYIIWFNKGNLNPQVIFSSDVDPYIFKLDNIKVPPGQTIHFSRYLTYLWTSPVNIDVWKFVNWWADLPQVKILPVDWCVKKYVVAINNWKESNRWYDFRKVDLQEYVKWYIDSKKSLVKNKVEDIQTKINNGDYKSILDQYWWVEDISDLQFSEWDDLDFDDILTNGVNLDVSLFESKAMDRFAGQLEDFTKNLCKWFSLWWDDWTKCWLEPPFNVAFFAPWIYNVFGCPVAWDPWRSILWYPWTKWKSCKHNPCCIPIPMPNKTSISPSSDPPNQFKPSPCPWVFLAKFRFYVAPTTTLGIGFAFCFWTYLWWLSFPHPWWTIAWNCVVVAKKDVLCKDKQKQKGNKDIEQSLEEWQYNLSDFWDCNKDSWWIDWNLSPFNIVYSNPNLEGDSWQQDEWFNTDLNGFEIWWNVLKLQRNYIWDTLKTKDVLLKKWMPINLKIEWWNLKWLVQCIIKKWLDRQIRYIINALTNMTIYVYLPDLSQLLEWWDKLKDLNKLKNDITTTISDNWKQVKKSLKDKEKWYTFKSVLLPRKEVFWKLSETFSNPFKQIEKFFEEIPLINIHTKAIVIKLPRLTEEEWERQKAYLTQWLDENKEVIKEWENLVKSAAWKCKENDENCKATYQKYLKIYTNIKQIESRVKQDIEAIDAWQRFPLQLYAYLHIVDKLLQSILCIIDKFFLSIVRWFHQNAVRFEKWVDFIILMIAVIKTWQILIDFSVKWKRSCGKCRVDNYDFYDCTLSVFCIDLPILPIPPFKLPDIYIDLSHIDIGLNITLPEFRFKPIRLPPIVLPTLPYPPKIWLNVKLPLPPEIPMPPQLPSITFNIPTPEIKLPPLLPPAPKLPPLMPPIKAVLDIAQWIWKIRCIIKNWIWLVAEWNTKTRIEQLTQRYSRVAPFDFLQLTLPKFPFPKYYDVRIDTYVNLKINFDMVYDMAKAFANVINWFTNWIIDEINKWTMKVEDGLNENAITIPDINADFDFQSFNDLFYKSEIATGDYFENYRKKLLAKIDILWSEAKWYRNEIDKIKDILKSKSMIRLNAYWLNKIKNRAKFIVQQKRIYYSKLAEKIKRWWWNALLKLANKNKLVVFDKEKEISLSTNILNVNPKVKKFIKNWPNPYKAYFELNKKIVDWLYKKINQKPYYAFGMTKQDWQASKIYLENVKSQLDKVVLSKEAFDVNDTNNKANWYFWLYDMADIWQFIHWFYVRWKDNKYRNIIYDIDFADKVRKRKTYLWFDFNGDWERDWIVWTDKEIYIKWSNQKKQIKNIKFSRSHYNDYIEEILYKPDYALEVNKFKLNSVSYDDVWISWLGDGYTKIYLIKLESRIDISYDQNQVVSSILPPDIKSSKYILAMDKSLDPGAIKIKYKDLKWFVYDLQKEWKLILKLIDPAAEKINLHLLIDPRKRRYARILKLKNISTPDFPEYTVGSSWSNQIVFGRSIWSDNVPPSYEVALIRSKTWQIVSKGKDLYGYVNTKYRLKVQWKDNVKVVKSWISDKKGNVIKQVENGILEISLYSKKPKQIVYYIWAVDQNWNVYKEQINVNIKVPIVNIDAIKVNDWYAQIIAKLSSQIDEWQIKFYRNRFGEWQILTGKSIDWDKSQFAVIWSNEYITGGLFSFNWTIEFKDIVWNIVWELEPDGSLALQKPYDYSVDISQGYPLILIYNNKTNKTIWKVFVKSLQLKNIKIGGDYEVLDLKNSLYWLFNGWKCVLDKDINQCVMYVTKGWLIYIPSEYRSDWNEISYKVVDWEKMFIFKSDKGKIEIYSE